MIRDPFQAARPRPALRSATALVATLSLALPGLTTAAQAQDMAQITADCSAEFAADPAALAGCIADRAAAEAVAPAEEVAPTEEDAAAAGAQAEAEAAAAAQADADAAAQADADAAAQAQADADAAAAAQAQADADAAAQVAADEEATRVALEAEAARLAEEQAAADAAQAQADADAQAAADAAQAQADADAQAAADAAQAQADADTQAAADAAQAQADAEAQTAADAAQAQADADTQAAADAAQAQADAEAQAAADAAQAQADAEAQTAADAAQAQADADAQTAADAAQAQADADAQTAADEEATRVALEAEAARLAEEQAAADAAAAAEVETVEEIAPADAVPADAGPIDGQIDTVDTQGAATDGAVALQADAAPAQETAPIVETQTTSALAEEIAAQPEPELTEEETTAVEQASQALGGIFGNDAGNAFATAAAAAGADATGAEVAEETVEAGAVRTSSEDFATSAIVSDNDDRDEPRFDRNDKILLGALGALAVGAVLVNNNRRARVVSNSGDRVVVQQDDGSLSVFKDDDVLLRQAGADVRTERFDDGSTRQTVVRSDGSRVVTIRDASLRVLRRDVIEANGTQYRLIDDTVAFEPVDVATLPQAPAVVSSRSGDALGAALAQEDQLGRRFSLAQIRSIPEVRSLAPAYEVSAVTFASGSAAIAPEQAANLSGMAREVLATIRQNPREVFLIEGHTDAVGDAAYNLALSDRRAESLALALNEYFDVPVENMVVQGYGESFLKVQTQTDERANRRATVRDITGLLQTAAAN